MLGTNTFPNPKRALIARGFSLAIVALAILRAGEVIGYADPLDFPVSDFNIMDADGEQVIGRGHYEITSDGNGDASVFGEDRFNNGEYDIERDRLKLSGGIQVPRMVTYEHTFFRANGTLQRANKANFQTAFASCSQYENGQPVVLSKVLQFPQDTFAGVAIVIPLRGYLLRGNTNGIVLHDFSCIPGPKILEVKAYPEAPSEWAHFPGQVVQVDIEPDFGLLNLIARLFVPKIRAWFSPFNNWRFVGGQFTRFYKGPEIILAITPNTGQGGASPNR